MFLASIAFSNLLSLPRSSPDWELSQADVASYELAYSLGVFLTIVSIIVLITCWKKFMKLRVPIKIVNIIWILLNAGFAVYGRRVDICNVQLKYQLQGVIFENPFWYGMIGSVVFFTILVIGHKWDGIKSLIYKER